MKKIRILLVVSLLTLGALGVSAQGLNFGVRAGLNVSSITDTDDAKYKPGFNAGVFGQYMFSGVEGFGLEAGLQYSMLGYKYDSSILDKTISASYIQLPIQALYKFSVGQNLYLYPSAGVYLGYGVGGTDDYFDGAEEFDFGLKGGVNLQFEKIIIGVGYEYGLTSIVKDFDPKNSNVVVSFGYLF